jgi:hypothetical protein
MDRKLLSVHKTKAWTMKILHELTRRAGGQHVAKVFPLLTSMDDQLPFCHDISDWFSLDSF